MKKNTGMAGYTKLFNSILASTIWREDDKTRIVWITLLAMANKDGIAEGSLPGLADMARVSIEDCKASLLKLESPDEYSRTKEHEGRRIETCDGGWRLLNHAKYRAKMSADERREYNRLKQQEWRSKNVNAPSNSVNDSQSQLPKSPLSAHTEAEADSEALHEREHGRFAERPSLEEVKMYASTIGLGAWKAEDWFQEMEGCGWLDFNSRPISKWQAVIARVKTKWEADGRPNTPPAARSSAQNGQGGKDTFWRDTERLKQVEGEIKAIEGRAAHTALDVVIQPQDKEKHVRLRAERKELKKKMGL